MLVPPLSVIAPIWDQFSVLLPEYPAVSPTHPLGCHRRRIPDRIVFDHVIDTLVHGTGYERIAAPGCSDRTIRRWVREWAAADLMQEQHALVLAQYDRMIGLEMDDVVVDGCSTPPWRAWTPGGPIPPRRRCIWIAAMTVA